MSLTVKDYKKLWNAKIADARANEVIRDFEDAGVIPVEIRASSTGNRLEGYIARFNSPTVIGGEFVERLQPGCFRSSLSNGTDVVCLKNHDDNQPLGRTSAGTLRLSEDSQGLAFSLNLPNTSFANDLRESVKRGDLKGCSFGFRCLDDSWDVDSRGNATRTIKDLELFEVSVGVTFPAYASTSSSLRGKAI